MLNAADNQLLTRTGSGEPLGALMRRFWIPVLLSEELPEADCPPIRVKLLGERLVAFRDTSGKVGFIDEFCAHRGVSLWFGRNEEHGLRCPYHGWKFDVNGQCMEVPSEPAESGYCNKIKLTSYPCVEKAGIIWTYMGPKDKQPEFPAFEWLDLPDSQRLVAKRWQECNWLQAMEGGIDSSHVSWLHSGELHTDPLHKGTKGEVSGRQDTQIRACGIARRHDHRRAPQRRGEPILLAHNAMDHALVDDDPALWRQCAERTRLGSDGR